MSQPVMIFCVAAPQDAHALAEWETHLLPLQQAGRILIWSERHILGGAGRKAAIDQHLAQADIITLLLSPDFFTSHECYAIMQWTIQRTQQEQARVVPLLLRPVLWRESALGELACLPDNERPIMSWTNPDEAFHACVIGITKLLPQPATQPSNTQAQLPGVQNYTSVLTSANQPSVPRYHSCFLSYAHQDEPLAQRLHADLQAQGVHCWFAPHDMKIGAKIRPTIDQAINRQEKLLLLISQHSINSAWVEDEIEAALEFERNEQREMLFPVQLDDSVMHTSQAWAAKLRRTRNIGDFTNWTEQEAYQRAFERLLGDLENRES